MPFESKRSARKLFRNNSSFATPHQQFEFLVSFEYHRITRLKRFRNLVKTFCDKLYDTLRTCDNMQSASKRLVKLDLDFFKKVNQSSCYLRIYKFKLS